MRHKALLWIFSLALLCFWGATAQSQEALTVADATGTFDIGEVVVEGKGETITQVSTVETVSRDRIDLINAENISDALESLPGVTVSVGAKNERNINVRGFNERYVPTFLDGIPIYIPNDGYVDTGNLPTSNLSKITLTKGISSALYGPNTMGGVINIVTMKPQKTFEGEIEAGYAEEKAFHTNVNLGSRLEKFYFTLSGGYLDSDGFRLSDDFDANAIEDGGLRDNSDVEQKSGAFKIGFTPTENQEYAIGVNLVSMEKGFPPSTSLADKTRYWRFTDWDKETYYLIGNIDFTEKFSAKIRAFHDEYYNVLDSYDDDTYSTQKKKSAFHSTYDDHSDGGSLTLRSRHIGSQTISAAFHYKNDVHEEQDSRGADWEKYETEMYSFGLEDDIKFNDRLSLVLGISYDLQCPEYAAGQPLRDDEDAFNPQAGLYLTVFEDTVLHASVGQKTRFPTMQELYSGLLGKNTPNPDLANEKATNYEIGFEKPLPADSLFQANLFLSDVDDKIVNKELSDGTDQYQNIGEARYQGFELILKTGFIPKNEVECHYTYLDAENRSDDRTSDKLEEVSEHQLYLSDHYKFNDWLSAFAKVQWNSERYQENSDGDFDSLDGFWTVDAKIMVKPAKFMTLEAGVKNLFDEDYMYSNGYPREGSTFFALVRATF
ncbi:MAG: TonB-dependent receptor [Desulfobacterales bacterium]|nr:TonB-dependent receptor [Desulfobacterales bacterium]MDD3080686.1 TonB-dependent receptor [Desulfobacterales bacterium]MDD3949508.1 TonB-dependent receptor [Desulfobacterales bacterium]